MTLTPITDQIKQYRELPPLHSRITISDKELRDFGYEPVYTPKPLKRSWLQRNDMRLADFLLGSVLGILAFPACYGVLWAIATVGEYWK